MRQFSSRIVRATVIILFILGAFGFGFALGNQNLQFQNSFIPKIVNKELVKPKEIDFKLFWDVYEKLQSEALRTAKPEELLYRAIKGLVSGLKDPNSQFLNPEEAKLFSEDLKGEFEGIGVEIDVRNGNLVVVAPLDGLPAQKAGLKAKDIILEINGEETAELSLIEAIAKIRGKKGTEVTLKIKRDGTEKEVKIVRETITVANVMVEKKDNGIFYLRLRQFGDDIGQEIKSKAEEIRKENPRGIILDLRDNPGGILEGAVEVAGLFLQDKKVVIQKFKGGKEEPLETSGEPIFEKIPLVVLVNGGSASASEIVAGAIQDYKRGKIIGEKTFGKGTVQTLEELEKKTALKLTIAEWLRPSGKSIEHEGVMPDIEVKRTDEEIEKDIDRQLERAIKEIKNIR